MRSRAPVSFIFSRKQPIGCKPVKLSTQARSFSLTPKASALRGGTPSAPCCSAARVASITAWPVMSTMASPFSGRKASRNTIDEIADAICSATPETTKPPYEWPHSTTFVSRSHLSRLTTSVTWVETLMPLASRCERSPSPVSVGVNTLCPLAASRSATRRQHQPPCQAP